MSLADWVGTHMKNVGPQQPSRVSVDFISVGQSNVVSTFGSNYDDSRWVRWWWKQ